MPTLSLRDVPQETYDALKRLSQRERRSMQQQAILLLDAARVLAPQPSVLSRAAAWRQRMACEAAIDVVAEIHQARAERP